MSVNSGLTLEETHTSAFLTRVKVVLENLGWEERWIKVFPLKERLRCQGWTISIRVSLQL